MKILKKTMLVFGATLILIAVSLNVSATSDGTNDVWHQAWTGTGYSWEAYSGTKDNIDITDLSYSIDGTTATITMTTVGDMTANSENVVYTVHLKSSDDSYYMLFYSNGQGTIMGLGNFQGFAEQINNPISGNTFSATFEISDPNLDYDVIGFNVEHSNINDEQGEAWWDYAPNTEAPYYSSDDSGGDDAGGDDAGGDDANGDDSGGKKPEKTPGFEILTLIAAIGIALILLKKRK